MKHWLFVIVFFTSAFFIRAQRYGFINYNVENGLAQSQVNAIGQDNKGYLWFATNGGVSRFDGKNFANLYAGDGLLDNQVNCVHIDSKGIAYLGTPGGINIIEGKSISTNKFNSENLRYSVKAMAEDKNGLLWLGTDGGGLISFDKESRKFTYYTNEHGLSDNFVRTLCSDDSGSLWIGTKRGLCIMKEGKLSLSAELDSLSNVSSIVFSRGKLWIGTYGDGVYSLSEKRKDHYELDDGLVELWIKSVTIDKEGNVWFSSSAGLGKYNGKEFLQFKEKQGLQYVNINTTFVDREGSLWLGSEGNGVYRFCGEGIITYSDEDGLGADLVMAISQDKNGAIWLGTYGGGIAKQEGNNFNSMQIPGGISQNYVYSCLVDRENNSWFGTALGLYKYDGKSFQLLDSKKGLNENTILSLLEDSRGNIWVGTTNGAFVYDGEKFDRVKLKSNSITSSVYKIYEDKNSAIWLASESGIISYDGNSFRNHEYNESIKVDNVMNIGEDELNNLWFGTSNGLLLFDRKNFKQITLSDNFSSNQINSLIIDKDNFLWAATNNGIYNFNISDYLNSGTLSLNHIGKLQGLSSIECNQNAAYFDDKKNRILIGTTAGLVIINKEKYLASNSGKRPILNLTGVRLFLQETDWSPFSDSVSLTSGMPLGLKIDYKKNHLTFDFIGILHSNPDNVRYKFKLEGFDDDWYPFTKETFATYSNLTYGEYNFVVALTNESGTLLDVAPAEFRFIITPPFWKTWWFTLVSFINLVIISLVIYRWRWAVIKRKREAQQLIYKSKLMALEQETLNASMNRHFIFNALNSIQYYINRQDKLAANKYLTSFAKLIRKNLDSSQNNLVTLSEELERLELYLSLEHMRFSRFTYKIKLGPDIDPDTLKIPPMILQPYVENSIWHGILPLPAEKIGEITVEVKKNDENSIVFIVEDNGIGIDESLRKKQEFPTEHDSKGMKITETRINLLRKMSGGNIEIKGPYDIKNEGKGGGTRVEIVLPMKK